MAHTFTYFSASWRISTSRLLCLFYCNTDCESKLPEQSKVLLILNRAPDFSGVFFLHELRYYSSPDSELRFPTQNQTISETQRSSDHRKLSCSNLPFPSNDFFFILSAFKLFPTFAQSFLSCRLNSKITSSNTAIPNQNYFRIYIVKPIYM